MLLFICLRMLLHSSEHRVSGIPESECWWPLVITYPLQIMVLSGVKGMYGLLCKLDETGHSTII